MQHHGAQEEAGNRDDVGYGADKGGTRLLDEGVVDDIGDHCSQDD